MNKLLANRWIKVLVFLACLVPVALLAWGFHKDALGANPVEKIEHDTGDWTIYLLLITLAITPLRKVANLPLLIRYRRMVGLFAFFYGVLHMLAYVWVDQGFDWPALWKDVLKRPYITAGVVGVTLMIPLAATSTAWAIRKLGGRKWQMLHRLVYFSALAGVIHYYWLVKSDVRKPLLYAGILALLMLYRAATWMRKRA
jgi:sulfoxide reductase heme-binding subunit YedZ